MDWRSGRNSSAIDAYSLCRLIVANRATHNAHAKEVEALEKQIEEWRMRISCEEKGEPVAPVAGNEMEEDDNYASLFEKTLVLYKRKMVSLLNPLKKRITK